MLKSFFTHLFIWCVVLGFAFTAVAQDHSVGKVPTTTENPAVNYNITLDAPTSGTIAYGHAGVLGQFVSMPIPAGDPFTLIGPMVSPVFFTSACFGPNGTYYITDFFTAELYSVDLSSGAYTLIGSTVWGLEGITYDWSTGTFFGVSATDLYTVDVSTGATTLVGALGAGGFFLDIAASCDGMLYGYDLITDNFYSVDPGTGAATVIGSLGYDAQLGQGMSYDYSTGILYLSAFNNTTFTGQLRTVDVATGNTTLVFDWGLEQVAPFAIDQVCAGGGTTFFDDFDSYIAGQQLACQNPIDWTTWTIAPCDPTEDPLISTNFAFSGSNSVVIVQNNDLVKMHGQLTSGKWYMSFLIYIPTGKAGYFNTLSGFTPNPFQWAMECYFDVGGGGRLMGIPGAPIAFTWLENTWQQVVVVVDLDTDNAEFWFGDNDPLTMVSSWQWTQGGGVNLQLDANDFFGATADDEMYMDNYYFSEILPPIIPVELTSFAATVNETDVVLNWTTATELNNQGFDVERNSGNGFEKIGFVAGFGTSTEIHTYTYTDNSLQEGTYTYRLKQVDFLGTYEYSDEIEVEVNGPLTFGLEQNYPNPFNPSTNIKYNIPESGIVKLAIYNTLGEEVSVLVDGMVQAGFYEVTFDASSLPSGAYFYQLKTKGYLETKKMILMK